MKKNSMHYKRFPVKALCPMSCVKERQAILFKKKFFKSVQIVPTQFTVATVTTLAQGQGYSNRVKGQVPDVKPWLKIAIFCFKRPDLPI